MVRPLMLVPLVNSRGGRQTCVSGGGAVLGECGENRTEPARLVVRPLMLVPLVNSRGGRQTCVSGGGGVLGECGESRKDIGSSDRR